MSEANERQQQQQQKESEKWGEIGAMCTDIALWGIGKICTELDSGACGLVCGVRWIKRE